MVDYPSRPSDSLASCFVCRNVNNLFDSVLRLRFSVSPMRPFTCSYVYWLTTILNLLV